MRNTSGLWRGGPGRRKGVPNRATAEARTFCGRLVGDPAYRENFERAWRERSLPPALEQMVWAYAFGKPSPAVDIGERQPTLAEIVAGVPLRDENDDDAAGEL